MAFLLRAAAPVGVGDWESPQDISPRCTPRTVECSASTWGESGQRTFQNKQNHDIVLTGETWLSVRFSLEEILVLAGGAFYWAGGTSQ